MTHNLFRIALIIIGCLVLGSSETFAQCGADGTQACPTIPKKNTPTKPTPKKTSKPTETKKTVTTKKLKTKDSTPTVPVEKPQTVVNEPPKVFPYAPKIEMVKIPAGSYKYGDETRVVNYDFYLGKYEVTQEQWQAVIGKNPSYFSKCGVNCPVENVSWGEVIEFIQKLNGLQSKYEYRLPTKTEWEHAACSSLVDENYPSKKVFDVAWFDSNSDKQTHPVGQKEPNCHGLYDMRGNVQEWSADVFDGENSKLVKILGSSFRYDMKYVFHSNLRDGTSTARDEQWGFRLAARTN